MPHNKKQGTCLSFIMSFIMIYVMAALNIDVRQGCCSAQAWLIAFQRLPLGFVVGILCDLLVCTPLSRRVVALMTGPEDTELVKVFVLRFSMVVLMTAAMTVFSVVVSGQRGMAGIVDFFTYLPYNFTIALPIQMLVVAPLPLRLARLAGE